jgi:hypothetical protein
MTNRLSLTRKYNKARQAGLIIDDETGPAIL